jgi:G:T-mismatch repair DNA endonuclease (very short patch repair protein)
MQLERRKRLLIAELMCSYDGPLLTQVVGLPSTPDVLLPDLRLVLAGMGCFWHGHEAEHCPIAHVPAIGPKRFDWVKKLEATRRRDARNRADLIARRYRVGWAWECAVTGPGALPRGDFDALLAQFIRRTATFLEIEGRPVGKPAVAA